MVLNLVDTRYEDLGVVKKGEADVLAIILYILEEAVASLFDFTDPFPAVAIVIRNIPYAFGNSELRGDIVSVWIRH